MNSVIIIILFVTFVKSSDICEFVDHPGILYYEYPGIGFYAKLGRNGRSDGQLLAYRKLYNGTSKMRKMIIERNDENELRLRIGEEVETTQALTRHKFDIFDDKGLWNCSLFHHNRSNPEYGYVHCDDVVNGRHTSNPGLIYGRSHLFFHYYYYGKKIFEKDVLLAFDRDGFFQEMKVVDNFIDLMSEIPESCGLWDCFNVNFLHYEVMDVTEHAVDFHTPEAIGFAMLFVVDGRPYYCIEEWPYNFVLLNFSKHVGNLILIL